MSKVYTGIDIGHIKADIMADENEENWLAGTFEFFDVPKRGSRGACFCTIPTDRFDQRAEFGFLGKNIFDLKRETKIYLKITSAVNLDK